MTLQEWINRIGADWVNKGTQKHLNKEVVKEYSQFKCWDRYEEENDVTLPDSSDKGWEIYIENLHNTNFTQQNIYSFVELEDGTLVGFNESPSHGWSFPTGKWKEE